MPEPKHRPPTLQRLVQMFRTAMVELDKSPTEADLERWAVLIHASMSGRGRSYHTVEHVFQVNGGADAIGSLATLFHDTVYCEVDGGLPRGLEPHLSDALHVDGDHVELWPFDPKDDPLRALVATLFGFTPGQAVTFQSGLNELASALLAVRSLRSHLSRTQLALIVTCIEATIPFRGHDAEETLFARLLEADASHDLGLGEAGAAEAVNRAVAVANRDVANFAYEDAGAFLSHTWELIPETNPTLRAPAYTIGEYRHAMGRMAGFFEKLKADKVFRSFRGSPDDETMAAMLGRAETNLQRGWRYLRGKLLAARMLEAFATLTSGDAPVILFMGDLPAESPDTLHIEHLLPKPEATAADVDREVFRLLVEGRSRESGFDLKTSPLAAYLYGALGGAESDRALEAKTGRELLAAIPVGPRKVVAKAAAQIAVTRAAQIEELMASLG